MAAVVPFITSNTTSLPEVGNGFSWLVAPDDFEGASRIIKRVLDQSPEVRERTRQAFEYARNQTWEKVARETREVYLKCLEESE